MLPGDHHISILSLRNLMNLSHCFPDPRQCLPILMSLPCRVTHHTPRALRTKAVCSNFPRRPRCRKLRKYVPNRVRQGIGQAWGFRKAAAICANEITECPAAGLSKEVGLINDKGRSLEVVSSGSGTRRRDMAIARLPVLLNNEQLYSSASDRERKQYTINTKIQSMCKIIKRSVVCSLQNKL